MRIMELIKEKKKAFSESQNKRAAEQLQNLKKKREREEGKARLIKLKNKEQERIKKAREVRLNDLKKRFGAPAPLKKSKAVPKKEGKLGNGFGQGINPAFNIGKK